MARPPHLCGCGKTVAHGNRCQCQVASTRARNRRHDATRPSARERGYTSEWQKARAAYLAAHPTCRMCTAPATVVDHIIPHRGDKQLFWAQHNWQPLCDHHHNSNKQRLDRQR